MNETPKTPSMGNLAALTHRSRWIVTALSALFFVLTLASSMQKSPGYDEPFHIASGLLYVQSGRIVRAPDHPPFIRELSGMMLFASGVRLPVSSDVQAVLGGARGDLEYPIGSQIIANNGPDHVLLLARLPLLLLGTAFIWVMYFFTRALVNDLAGICVAFLCALDPLVLSNFGIVYTDASVMLFTVLTVMALWYYVQRPSWLRILWCGLALGVALGTKYSAVALFPAIAMLLLTARIWPTHHEAPCPQTKTRMAQWANNYVIAFTCMCAIACSVLMYIFLWPKEPLFYLNGMHEVNRNHNPQWLFYLGGQYAKHFYRYYAEAWLLKEPLATIALTLFGVVLLARTQRTSRLACLFLLVPGGLMFAGYSLLSDNLGVRYVLPVLPFCMVAAAVGFAALWQGRRWMRITAAIAAVWIVVAAICVYPDHMSYFNESACLLTQPSHMGLDGGTQCGYEWLDDSNVDNGEGLKEVRSWIDQNAQGKKVYFGLFGSIPPATYGVPQGNDDYGTVLQGTAPGLYVVSSQFLARAHPGPGYQGGSWLLHTKPLAFVHHSFFIYERR